MTRRVNYWRELLRATDAFLEGSPDSRVRAHRMVQRCNKTLKSEAKRFTIDYIVWNFIVACLTDSIYYEDKQFLQGTREALLGRPFHGIARKAVFFNDFCVYFTHDEAEWYAQLRNMLDFLIEIPFTKIHKAASQSCKKKERWETMLARIPEVAQAEHLEEEYQNKKASLEEAAIKNPIPEYIGDEKIYQLILREVTEILTAIRVGKAAVYLGYPTLEGSYTIYQNPAPTQPVPIDITQQITRAKMLLEALEGKETLFLSWYLRKGLTTHNDILSLSLP